MISFSCTHCRQNLEVKDELAGKKGKCPHCGRPLRVPAMVSRGSPHDDATLAPPAGSSVPGRSPVSSHETHGSASDGSHPPTAPGAGDAVSILAPPQRPDEMGRLGQYRVLNVLGQGGMGVVYKAEDPHLERPVALKAMLPCFSASTEARQRFLREAKAAAAVKHDHVITIYQVGEDRMVPFLAMEFLEGEPLDKRLQREPILPIPEVLRIGREVAEGLAAAHERALIHRDIKPANIWLEKRTSLPRVKILDFGLARGGSKGQEQLTQTGAIMGTPAFMAPEQARGERVDARCDLFSLGCVLYRMSAGELPFKGNDPISTLMSVATVNPPSVNTLNSAVPPALAKLVNRLLSKDPSRRPASARAVAEELAALERTESAWASAAVSPPPAPARSGNDDDPKRGKRAVGSTKRQPKPARIGWLPFTIIGGAIGTIAVGILAAHVIIRIKNKDGTETKAEAPKGSTIEIEKDGKTVARVPDVAAATNSFFNGKDLTGWEGLASIWGVEKGAIVGTSISGWSVNTFLCSKRKYRDFDLKFEVRRKHGTGNSGVQFRSQLIDRTKFTVKGPQCEIDSAAFDFPPGSLLSEPDPKPFAIRSPRDEIARKYRDTDFNAYHIRCVGKHVTIEVNGVTAVDRTLANLPDEGIIAWQMHGRRPPWEITFRNIEFTDLSMAETGWLQLFNGKDLNGWKVFPSGEGNWRVEDGAITCSGGRSHLFSDRGDYENFHFRVEAKINAKGNSGQYFRTPFIGGAIGKDGYEAQIALPGGDPSYFTGSLYGIVPVREILHDPDEWFTQEVIASGDHIIIEVNGKAVVDVHDLKHAKGHLALQHNNVNTSVYFRKVEVKELLPGKR
jgi:serine/threonine protein kinase